MLYKGGGSQSSWRNKIDVRNLTGNLCLWFGCCLDQHSCPIATEMQPHAVSTEPGSNQGRMTVQTVKKHTLFKLSSNYHYGWDCLNVIHLSSAWYSVWPAVQETNSISLCACILSSSPGFDDFHLSIHSDMATVAKAMACPESGLEVRDRMWLKITIANAFIGTSTCCVLCGVS